MASTGTESRYDWPSAVMTLVRPGPGTTMHAAGRPVARAKPSAMNPAPPSCLVVTTRRSARPVRPSKGSGALSVQASGGIEEALLQQVELGAAVHLALQDLEAVDLAFGLAVAPG